MPIPAIIGAAIKVAPIISSAVKSFKKSRNRKKMGLSFLQQAGNVSQSLTKAGSTAALTSLGIPPKAAAVVSQINPVQAIGGFLKRSAAKILGGKKATKIGTAVTQVGNYAERIRSLADMSQYETSGLSNKGMTGAKAGANRFLSTTDAKRRAIQTGATITTNGTSTGSGSNMIWIVGAIAALFLIPRFLKR